MVNGEQARTGTELGLDGLIADMSLEEKIGQLVMFGFSGTEPTERLSEWLATGRVGNVIYFTRNIESPSQLAGLSDRLQASAQESRLKVPLFLSTDQEGGAVSRLSHGATRLPSAMALGAADDRELAVRTGRVMGAELRACGVNFNLAPVLDVNNNPENPVIGVRSFGERPDRVAALGTAVIEGLQRAGVAACGKHFPGHGDTAVDSHLALPVVPHARGRLEQVEFVPFRAAIEAGVAAIMTAHVVFPAIEPESDRPSTLSRAVLTELLRREMGFDGLIVTDCLEMNAVKDGVGTAEGALQALLAGADIVLVSHTASLQEATLNLLAQAAGSGELPAERIDAAVRRVLAAKARFGLRAGERPLRTDVEDRVGTPEGAEVAAEAGRKSVTLLRGADLLPLVAENANRYFVLEVEARARSAAEDAPRSPGSLAAALADRIPGIAARRLSPGGAAEGLADSGRGSPGAAAGRNGLDPSLLELAAEKELVVVVTQTAGGDSAQCEWVRRLVALKRPKVFVVSLRSPYDLRNFPDVAGYLAAYASTPPQVEAAADVLCGVRQARGKLPVSL